VKLRSCWWVWPACWRRLSRSTRSSNSAIFWSCQAWWSVGMDEVQGWVSAEYCNQVGGASQKASKDWTPRRKRG
jgi:hypothetical protein